MEELRVYAFKSHTFNDNINLTIYQKNEPRVYVAQPVTMEEINPALDVRPTFSLTPTAAQELIDRLWDCGLRPSEGAGSAGALAATQKHLGDMRTLVFHSLGIKE